MTGDGHMPGKIVGASLPTILLVASDPTLLKLLKMALQLEFACDILAFESGRCALETARHVRADLVVMHFYLLHLDALELVDRLHSMKGSECVPTLLTHVPLAYGNAAQRPYLTVLTLPFGLEAFYAAVHTCLLDRT
jgi:response regulator RpfG family c-di-GMP phosphodiesterase